ncbi:MAG: hypothetical protein K9M97_03600 [Akkermansiaceae bacterium]|nr:hypothetical protein [Akkermansiaceae bacterium]
MFPVAAHAAVVVSGDVNPANTATWDDTSTWVYIGDTGNGSISADTGAVLNPYVTYLGNAASGVGEVTVSGAGTLWETTSSLAVGVNGHGTLNIENGATFSNTIGALGVAPGASGTVKVDGTGSVWTSTSTVHIGSAGDGIVHLKNGGAMVTTGQSFMGYNSGSKGDMMIDGSGSLWTSSGNIYVGRYANATVSLTNGGSISQPLGGFYAGYFAGTDGSISIDGTNSSWTLNNTLNLALSGSGSLDLTNGGHVSNLNAELGYNAGAVADVLVTGANTTWESSGNLRVGRLGSAVVEISDGALVKVGGSLEIDGDLNGDSFINMSTGGRLALLGEADESIAAFLGLSTGSDAIRYWESDWTDISFATVGVDYSLAYFDAGELAGFTVLTVAEIPEPSVFAFVIGVMGFFVVFERNSRR